MAMNGPRCPACGSRVKLPSKGPVPKPTAKVKCPSCGSVGELEAFARAAAMGDVPESAAISDGARTIPVGSDPLHRKEGAGSLPEESAGATKVAGSASRLNLPPGIRCTITVLSGPDEGKKMIADRPRIVVGQGRGDFPLTDSQVSEEHCVFEITGVTCHVKDMGSRGGTWVDGERVENHTLGNMGEVAVGNTTLLFTMTLDEESGES